ncbi:MAG TPA: toll/interleukin-1 receptor domain-containing protein [Sphingomicrobium sp.]
MAKLARLPANDRTPQAAAEFESAPRLQTRYYAFLSYSHKDKELADWLHRELEKYRVPRALHGRLTANGVVPKRLTPIFRDEHDLAAAGDLGGQIKATLAASQFLVVLCSPTAAVSRWTNAEVEWFKHSRPEGCALAAIASGEPFASEMPGREDEECFPPALRQKYDRRGRPTGRRAEPLAADLRGPPEARRLGFLKLVAGMLGVGLDELVQRETTRRNRRLAWLAAASLGGMAVTSTLAVTAIQARDSAREQRREAEGLVAFMLGDLKDKLEPIGRLDALDGVGSRVLAYFSKQDTSELSDAALTQRSKALSLMAEVANARGDFDTSSRLYREAMAGTAEAIRRQPSDPERIFEHAQNVFYFGELRLQLGDLKTAEGAMREYQRLALQMSALQPDNMKYRMEQQYADYNLGVVLYDQRRFGEAVAQFKDALGTMEAISTADPSNKAYRQSVAESLAWLADAERAVGSFDDAIGLRQRNVAIYNELYAKTGDVRYREHLIPAISSLGNLYAERGQQGPAADQFRQAISQAAMLTAVEPGNTVWQQYGFESRIGYATVLLAAGQRDEAGVQTNAACKTIAGLLRQPAPKPDWRIGQVDCLLLQGQLALAAGAKDDGLRLAQQAIATARTVHTVDRVADASLLERAYRVTGDIARARGDLPGAQAAWTSALSQFLDGVPLMPRELAEHAMLLDRLGRAGEAQQLKQRLAAMGYKAAALG